MYANPGHRPSHSNPGPQGYKGAHLGASTPTGISKPDRPPYSTPTFAGIGYWAIPFKVRYAIAFTKAELQGPLSEWTPWYTSSQYSNTVLTRFPVDSNNMGSKFSTCQNPKVPDGINVYRQFQTQPAKLIYHLKYPHLGQLIDMRPDTH